MTTVLVSSLHAWWPELCLSLGALAAILLGVFARRASRAALGIAWIALAVAAVSVWAGQPPDPSTPVFFGLITIDAFSGVFRWVALAAVGLVALMITQSRDVEQPWIGEYVGLVLLLGVGLMLMAESAHLLMAYVSIEMVSLSSYSLVALSRDARASEAALKYLLFGALSSGIMLFGMSLLYGLTGQLMFAPIASALAGAEPALARACAVAVALVLVGLAFKISMVPFHMWTPDIYEGAPFPVAALLSVGPKAAGIALVLRLMSVMQPVWGELGPLLIGLTVLTMLLGNLVALAQTNIKRLLAYSTIGQVGYLLIGVVASSRIGVEAVLVYVVAYLFMNLGIFACAVAVCEAAGTESLDAFRGLAGRSPVLAACCALFLLSLAGIPPLLGFLGKFLLFGSAIAQQQVLLAVAGVVASAIALYYYVNIIRLMYLVPASAGAPVRPTWSLRLAVGLCSAATLALGLAPSSLLAWISRSV